MRAHSLPRTAFDQSLAGFRARTGLLDCPGRRALTYPTRLERSGRWRHVGRCCCCCWVSSLRFGQRQKPDPSILQVDKLATILHAMIKDYLTTESITSSVPTFVSCFGHSYRCMPFHRVQVGTSFVEEWCHQSLLSTNLYGPL